MMRRHSSPCVTRSVGIPQSCAAVKKPADYETSCGKGHIDSCHDNGCNADRCLTGRSLAMVYSPCQSFDNLFSPSEGICSGTIFRELYKPFAGGKRGV